MLSIKIVPIQFNESNLLEHIVSETQKMFECSVDIQNIPFETQFAYNPSREQFNSTLLLSKLIELFPNTQDKVIGITSLDLYIPVLTFVFGEAQLNGIFSVVSSYRLYNQFYGLPENQKLFNERILKEIWHELGHTFGLIHCQSYQCSMHASTYVEEIDLKSADFCSSCKSIIQQKLFLDANQ